eukprot:CAMPEP_0115486186 /NCGR_PEP_ID=MMETSP0271-20121206/60306_1 /TAXON_ID=71861 /ORGANISM="Scrippsiella trochoidea, Strain CCMP3099" /LENGTH=149 /DNA_ID=CAMNT_0002914189 /DNA_START=44 /DNA_END=489 /DNA_ORIENTATION=-
MEERGILGPNEIRVFAALCGFGADDDVWVDEYLELCAQSNWIPEQGVALHQFSAWISDVDGPGYCSAPELERMLRELNNREGEFSQGREAFLLKSSREEFASVGRGGFGGDPVSTTGGVPPLVDGFPWRREQPLPRTQGTRDHETSVAA